MPFSRPRGRLPPSLCAFSALLCLCLSSELQAQSFGTEYVTFVRGDLRIIATTSETEVELVDLDTGALATGVGANPRVLSIFDSWELDTLGSQRHFRVSSSDATGGSVPKPIVVWTGQLEDALKHPSAPPNPPPGNPFDPTNDPWMSYLPALRGPGAASGAEVGLEFFGFTSRDVFVIARKGSEPSLVVIQDELTNVDFDADDDKVLTAASPELIYSDPEIEAWFITGFEDDTIRVGSNVPISVLVGFNPEGGRDWTATPPSYAVGDEGSELGTEFYAFVHSGLSVFPTQDDTQVEITDLTDQGSAFLDDSTSVTLADGDPANPRFDFWTAVTSNFNSPGLTPRTGPAPAPIVTVHTNEPDAFENDLVKVVSNKPVLLYTGPIGSDVREFADVAFSVPTGTLERLTYAYAQNGDAQDMQIFAFDPATNVTITSLTVSIPTAGMAIFHDFDIPVPDPWLGHASINERYWQSGIWRGELLRIESDRPITVINGDYDNPHYGAFIPFVRLLPLLPPIAIAEALPDEACPTVGVTLSGAASFDQDDEGAPPQIVACSWDVDISIDSDGNGVPDDDVDSTLCIESVGRDDCGSFTARLTVTDNEGETDTDEVTYTREDVVNPTASCPDTVVVECGPESEQAYLDWLELFSCSDDCGFVDHLEIVPLDLCGETSLRIASWLCTDRCGNEGSCGSVFTVQDSLPPELTVGLIESCYPTVAEAEAAALAQTSAEDACDAAPVLSVSSMLDGCDLLITVVARDACRNAAAVDYATIVDATPPLVMPPPELVLECDGPGGIPVSDPRVQDWLASASATDDCGPVSVTNDVDGVLLPGCPPGEPRAVIFGAVDACGNATLEGSNITVVDTTPPELTVPAPIIIECNSPGGVPLDDPQVQAWIAEASATDLCGGVALLDDAPAFLPAGCGPDGAVTTVLFTATDDCGLLTELSSSITVVDTTPPELAVPAPIVLECNAPGGVPLSDPAVQAWLASAMATDLCGGVALLDDAPAVLPAGCGPDGAVTTVLFTATDDCGLLTELSSSVTVVDTTPPELAVPPPIVLECNAPGGVPLSDPAVQAWLAEASASDLCGGVALVDDAPAVLPAGCGPDGAVTTVLFTATDDCGLLTELSSSVTVVDTTPPELAVPPPIVLECNAPGGVRLSDPAVQAWLASAMATDLCGDAALGNDAPAFLPSGCGPDGAVTTVLFTATDDCGLLTELSSSITVVDTTPPELAVPAPIVLECNAPGGVRLSDPAVQAWLASATASDLCGNASLAHDAPALFPAGCAPDGVATPVTFTATDDCGLTTALSSTITVVDTTPPVVTVSAQRLACLWPPNHRHVCFTQAELDELIAPLISDLCESEPINWRIAGCTSDQPDDARDDDAPGWNGDGHTVNDCVVAPDGSGFCARSERAGAGPTAQDGRHYTLSIIAVDACGNESEPTPAGHVSVPHDQSPHEKDCVDASKRGLRSKQPLPF